MDHIREKHYLLKDLDKQLLKTLEKAKCFIAGGAVRSVFAGEKIQDYDIFFKDVDGLHKVYEFLTGKIAEDSANTAKDQGGWHGQYKKVVSTDNAFSFYDRNNKIRIQLIRAFISDDIEYIFSKFDFTACMGAYDLEHDKFLFGARFFRDNTSKRLIINLGTEYPISTLIRIKKYIKKGYTINGIEMVKLALTINNICINNHADLQHHLMGIDTTILADLFDQNGNEVGEEGVEKTLEEIEYNYTKAIERINNLLATHYKNSFLGEGED